MPIPEILKQMDAEIARLKQVRNILAGEIPAPKLKAKRTRSAEARQRIGEAPRRRWAAEKSPVVTVLEPVVRRTRATQPRTVEPATTRIDRIRSQRADCCTGSRCTSASVAVSASSTSGHSRRWELPELMGGV